MLAAGCAPRTVRAAAAAVLDDDATVGTYEVCETRCLPTRVRRRKRLLLTGAALEQRAESLASTFGVGGPWSRLKRRLVTYVPLMPTSKLGNPVAMLVLVVPDDLALHGVRVRRADGLPHHHASLRVHCGTQCHSRRVAASDCWRRLGRWRLASRRRLRPIPSARWRRTWSVSCARSATSGSLSLATTAARWSLRDSLWSTRRASSGWSRSRRCR